MKYVSFSLWGDKKIYNVGVLKNAELCKSIYKDWQMSVFYDSSVPSDIIEKLNELNVVTVDVSDKNIYGMFWRFFAVDLPNAEYCIFRDADSRLSHREKLAVDEWIESGKSIHVMRDHLAHKIPYGNNKLGILGGMWGIKVGSVPLSDMVEKYAKNKQLSYGSDQTFLKTIYSIFESDRFTHDDFFEKKPFPIERENGRFVGQRIDENENPLL